jgi:hypothetical protein
MLISRGKQDLTFPRVVYPPPSDRRSDNSHVYPLRPLTPIPSIHLGRIKSDISFILIRTLSLPSHTPGKSGGAPLATPLPSPLSAVSLDERWKGTPWALPCSCARRYSDVIGMLRMLVSSYQVVFESRRLDDSMYAWVGVGMPSPEVSAIRRSSGSTSSAAMCVAVSDVSNGKSCMSSKPILPERARFRGIVSLCLRDPRRRVSGIRFLPVYPLCLLQISVKVSLQ